MKKVLAITLMLLLCATVAMAANQSSWRILLKADDGLLGNPGPGAYFGVYPTSLEGLDTQDGAVSPALGNDTPGTTANVLAVVPGQPDLYGKSIKAPTEPLPYPPGKFWDLYVAGNINYPGTSITLRTFTVNAALPTAEFLPNQPAPAIKYWLVLVDNKGKEGAPANGSKWEIPIPTVHQATAYWTMPVTLPTIKLSSKANSAMIAEGYKMQFVQECVVPEPSGLLALGAGLMGLVGFVTRRRK